MNTRKMSSAGRLQTGAAILAAAQMADIGLVKPRLNAFAGAHRRYAEAQHQLESAEAQLREERVRLPLRDAEQDQAVE